MGEQKKKKKRGKIALYFLYAAITVFLLVMILSFNDIGQIFDIMATADIKYVLIALLLLLVYLALSPLTLCILTRSRKNDISFKKTYAIGMTEHFFNGITPFATGGQPFQIYAFSRSKVKASESTSLLLMNFLVMMIVTNTYAALSLIFYARFVTDTFMMVISIVGFSINFTVLLCTIAMGTSKTVRRFLSWCVRVLCKIKFVAKFLEPQIPKLNEYFEQVQTAFKDLFRKPATFFSCIAVKAVMMGVYYTITFFIIRALHIDVGFEDLFFVICGTSFAITMVVFLPTPGSSGGIEFAFATIFASIIGAGDVGKTIAYGGMLMWRLMTYYLAMIVSLLFYVGFEIEYNVRKRKEAKLLPAEAETEDGSPPGTELPEEPADVALPGDAAVTEDALSEDGEPPEADASDKTEAQEGGAIAEETEQAETALTDGGDDKAVIDEAETQSAPPESSPAGDGTEIDAGSEEGVGEDDTRLL